MNAFSACYNLRTGENFCGGVLLVLVLCYRVIIISLCIYYAGHEFIFVYG